MASTLFLWEEQTWASSFPHVLAPKLLSPRPLVTLSLVLPGGLPCS